MHSLVSQARLRTNLTCWLLFASACQAFAIGLRFSPLNFSIQAKPGQVVNKVFTLSLPPNASATQFRAHLEDWWRSEDNRQTFYAVPGTIRRSCASWCTINPVESLVKPGETLTIKLSIKVPDSVEPGGYWCALTVDEVPDPLSPKPEGVAMVFRTSVSVGIFVQIPPCERSAKLVAVRIDGDRVAVKMRNDGNTPLKITGTIEFYKLGEDKPTAVVRMGAEPLLPEPMNTCEFSTPLPSPKELPSGLYKVRVIMDAGLDYLMGAEKELEIARADTS
jgi:hypothetical protein